MKLIFLYLSIAIASGLLFTNIYNSMVDARNWSSDVPNSINTAREYFKAATPAKFFRLFSPINQVLAIIVLIAFWKSTDTRIYFISMVVAYVLADVLTFAYFYPRNTILFTSVSSPDQLKAAATEWSSMNWIRSLIVAMGLIISFLGLHKINAL